VDYILSVCVILTIYVVLATSLNVVLGHGGLLSLCHAAFYGIGAYTSALIALNFGWGFLLSAAAGSLAAAALAALLAIPLLKLHGDYFILGSLGFQIIIFDLIQNADAITNGSLGLSRIPRPQFFGYVISSPMQYAFIYVTIAAVWTILVHYLTHAPFGKALNAVREDETAAVALGKNVRSIRVRAFALSATGAGVAGAMYAHYVTYIDPTSFTFTESVYILSIVIVGGVATTLGPMLGALALVLAPESLRFLGFATDADANLRQLLYGMLLILFAFWRPRGLAGRDVF
jgi:branched-chain amino acid transport system permease protein